MSLPLSPAGRRYGYIPAPPDARDFTVAEFLVAQKLEPALRTVSLELDLEPYCGPVFDQGKQGSCTATAGCGDLEFDFNIRGPKEKQGIVLSRSFLYYMERKENGSLDEGDCGSDGRTSCAVLNKYGVCAESDMPYRDSDCSTAPTPAQLQKALVFKTGAYHTLSAVGDIRSCVNSKYGVRIGIAIYESFESDQVANTGIVPVPDKSNEQLLGYHETFLIGVSDSKQAVKVRNSWGGSWGAKGNFWLPYKFVADPDLFLDGWIQHQGKPW